MNCILIKTDGVIKIIDSPSDLKSLSENIDGYIEVVKPGYMNNFKSIPQTVRMLVDEDGKNKNMEVNYVASCCYCGGVYDSNYIAGDVIICNYDNYRGPCDFKNPKDINVVTNVLNIIRDALVRYDYVKLN